MRTSLLTPWQADSTMSCVCVCVCVCLCVYVCVNTVHLRMVYSPTTEAFLIQIISICVCFVFVCIYTVFIWQYRARFRAERLGSRWFVCTLRFASSAPQAPICQQNTLRIPEKIFILIHASLMQTWMKSNTKFTKKETIFTLVLWLWLLSTVSSDLFACFSFFLQFSFTKAVAEEIQLVLY